MFFLGGGRREGSLAGVRSKTILRKPCEAQSSFQDIKKIIHTLKLCATFETTTAVSCVSTQICAQYVSSFMFWAVMAGWLVSAAHPYKFLQYLA